MIKFSVANIDKKLTDDVNAVLRSGWLTHGKFTEKFENEIKKFTGAKYCTLVSSCTAALHISCLALKLKKGDEVIVPAMSHTATSHAVEYTGAKTVFADIDIESGNVSIPSIKKLINKKTRAIIIVHMAGRSCELKEILKICKTYKIKLIEDCAHSLGTKYKNKHVGNFGVSGCFSFYPTKQITTGEGGVLITNDYDFYKKIKTLKAFGIDKDIKERKNPGEYNVNYLGFNYRMTDFQAAMGFNQLKKYKQSLARRKEIAKRYIKLLKKNKKIDLPRFSNNDSYFVFQILLNNKNDKFILMKEFKKLKIGVSVHYGTPLPLMTYYKKKYNIKETNYINSKNYGDRVLSLPVYSKLKNSEIEYISATINKFIN
jgi:perosamine synthetase